MSPAHAAAAKNIKNVVSTPPNYLLEGPLSHIPHLLYEFSEL
ncbi:hypothetical protein A5E_B0101 [Vibrio cholerae B33]|nr:hypothetical protein A5E_B0101 [Vibrio cholerae B33]